MEKLTDAQLTDLQAKWRDVPWMMALFEEVRASRKVVEFGMKNNVTRPYMSIHIFQCPECHHEGLKAWYKACPSCGNRTMWKV